MDFLKLIRQLDELLYEVMSWLVFYPVTLWRALRHPSKMMDYSDAELGDPAERQYTDTLSPPLFLLLTLVLSHALELSLLQRAKQFRLKRTAHRPDLVEEERALVRLLETALAGAYGSCKRSSNVTEQLGLE